MPLRRATRSGRAAPSGARYWPGQKHMGLVGDHTTLQASRPCNWLESMCWQTHSPESKTIELELAALQYACEESIAYSILQLQAGCAVVLHFMPATLHNGGALSAAGTEQDGALCHTRSSDAPVSLVRWPAGNCWTPSKATRLPHSAGTSRQPSRGPSSRSQGWQQRPFRQGSLRSSQAGARAAAPTPACTPGGCRPR